MDIEVLGEVPAYAPYATREIDFHVPFAFGIDAPVFASDGAVDGTRIVRVSPGDGLELDLFLQASTAMLKRLVVLEPPPAGPPTCKRITERVEGMPCLRPRGDAGPRHDFPKLTQVRMPMHVHVEATAVELVLGAPRAVDRAIVAGSTAFLQGGDSLAGIRFEDLTAAEMEDLREARERWFGADAGSVRGR